MWPINTWDMPKTVNVHNMRYPCLERHQHSTILRIIPFGVSTDHFVRLNSGRKKSTHGSTCIEKFAIPWSSELHFRTSPSKLGHMPAVEAAAAAWPRIRADSPAGVEVGGGGGGGAGVGVGVRVLLLFQIAQRHRQPHSATTIGSTWNVFKIQNLAFERLCGASRVGPIGLTVRPSICPPVCQLSAVWGQPAPSHSHSHSRAASQQTCTCHRPPNNDPSAYLWALTAPTRYLYASSAVRANRAPAAHRRRDQNLNQNQNQYQRAAHYEAQILYLLQLQVVGFYLCPCVRICIARFGSRVIKCLASNCSCFGYWWIARLIIAVDRVKGDKNNHSKCKSFSYRYFSYYLSFKKEKERLRLKVLSMSCKRRKVSL